MDVRGERAWSILQSSHEREKVEQRWPAAIEEKHHFLLDSRRRDPPVRDRAQEGQVDDGIWIRQGHGSFDGNFGFYTVDRTTA